MIYLGFGQYFLCIVHFWATVIYFLGDSILESSGDSLILLWQVLSTSTLLLRSISCLSFLIISSGLVSCVGDDGPPLEQAEDDDIL